MRGPAAGGGGPRGTDNRRCRRRSTDQLVTTVILLIRHLELPPSLLVSLFVCLSPHSESVQAFKCSSALRLHTLRPNQSSSEMHVYRQCLFRRLSRRLYTLSQSSRLTSEVNQPCPLSGPAPAPVGGSPPRSRVRPQHRHTPVNPRFSGASRRSGQSYGLIHPPLQSVSTRRDTMRWELINHLSSRRAKAQSAVNGANAIMNSTINSWPAQSYLPAGVPKSPQQCSAWYLRNKHPSQTCSCVSDRASVAISSPIVLTQHVPNSQPPGSIHVRSTSTRIHKRMSDMSDSTMGIGLNGRSVKRFLFTLLTE